MAEKKHTPPSFAARQGRRRFTLVATLFMVLTLVVAGIAKTPGTKTQQVLIDDPHVWAIRSGSTSSYGNVNTEIAELSSVHTGNSTNFPVSGVLQYGNSVVLYSPQSIVPLDTTKPVDVSPQDILRSKPLGADVVDSSGPYVVFLNRSTGDLGGITIEALAAGSDPSTINRENTNSERESFRAATITSQGIIYAVNSSGEAISHRLEDGKRSSLATGVAVPDNAISTAMTVFAQDHWALLVRTEDESLLWIDGQSISTQLTSSAALAQPSLDAKELIVADENGLHFFDTKKTKTRSIKSNSLTGSTPAAPIWDGECTYGAWSTGATMSVSSCGGDIAPLDVGSGGAGGNADPVFRTNGSHIILNDAGSGLVWTLNDKKFTLVASSAQWQKDAEDSTTNEAPQNKDAQSNECPSPAAGAQAEFGVRPGLATSIPVLVGAQDPNPSDTITIIPSDSSPSWEGSGLGDLSLTNNNQSVVVKPTADSGSARFSYTITDGSADCSVNGTASVSVHPDSVRSAPEFRAENSDSLKHLQTAPGTSVRFNGLAGWVDPDGDSLYISSVTASAGSVAATAQGMVAYHADNDQPLGTVTVTVTVSDSHGDGTATHTYSINVTDAPTLHARSFARSVPAGTTQTIDLSEYISGITLADVNTARVEISNASVENESQAADISIQSNSDALTLTVTPITEGIFPISYKVESGNSGTTGMVLVNSYKSGASLSVPPITAFVRPDEDVTVDPLALATNPTNAVLIVKDPETRPVEGGALSVGVISGSSLRISGQTANGQAGQVGVATYTVTDGENTTTGQVTVFELDEDMSTKPVTVPDQATVRAGEQMDIPVLANDVPAAGTNLVLDPSYAANNDMPGLTFATDTTLRYLAPDEPGYYTLFYRTYALGHFDEASEGQVTVHVTAKGENRPPNARNLSARVEAHNSAFIDVPTFGADPDGDDTFVTSVTQPASGGFASIASDGRIRVISTADTGPIEFDYTLSDASGLTSTATVRVGVIEDAQRAPIAYNDYIEVKPGTGTVSLNPVLNDTGVAGQRLVVDKVELKPANRAMQTDDEEEDKDDQSLKARIGEDNEITLDVPNTPGKVIYRYFVNSVADDAGEDEETSTAEGVIVINVTDQAQPIYPIVHDSVIGTNDIVDESFAVDVLADKTVWSGGALRTEVLKGYSSVSMNGAQMRGNVSTQRQTIPFSVTGVDAENNELRTWAFVKVPQSETIQPELLDSTQTYTVDQGESISIDLNDAIRPFGNRKVQVVSASAGGAREGATCSASGNTVTYAAGNEPLGASDTCHVTVQWKGYNRSVTSVSLPIRIILKDPPPVINSRQVAVVDPGQSATYDLTEAVAWSGQDKNRLRFECDGASGANGVTVRCEGSTAHIEVSDTASQGAIAHFGVRVVSPSFQSGVPEGRLSVQVGTLAPLSLNPTGTTVTINVGESASVTTDDLVAQNNSLRHYGELSLVPGSASFSGGLSGSINGGRVTITASNSVQGGVKTGSVRIQDSQGNTGTIPITVNVNARPNQPNIQSYSSGNREVGILIRDNSVASVPAVQNYTVTWSGAGGSGSKTCDAGVCTISGLRNAEAISVSVTANNAQGSSTPATLTTWAYAPPTPPTIAFDEPLTDGQGRLTVKAGDNSGNQIAVYVGTRCETVLHGSDTVTLTGLPVGKNNAVKVYAEAISEIGPPPTIQQVSSSSGRSNEVYAYSVGRPELGSFEYNTTSDSGVSVTISRLETGGEGIDWYWTVNGKQYGDVHHSTGKQSVTIPGSALNQNQENTIGLKAFSTHNGKRVPGAENEFSFKVMTYKFPTSAEKVTYSFDSSGTKLILNNTTSADGYYTAELIPGTEPTPGTCTAQIRWRHKTETGRVSNAYQIGPASGSQCYAYSPGSISYSKFEDYSAPGSSQWTPSISGLPKNRDDYDINLEVIATVNGRQERFTFTPVWANDTTVEFRDQKGNPANWSSYGSPYTLNLTITFKNKLEGIGQVQKTITVTAG